jgi:hypothetical protein
MVPYHFLKIGNSKVEFDVGTKQKISTKHSKEPSGPSPNFLEHFEVDLKIPDDLLFIQPINFRVFDKRLFGKNFFKRKKFKI